MVRVATVVDLLVVLKSGTTINVDNVTSYHFNENSYKLNFASKHAACTIAYINPGEVAAVTVSRRATRIFFRK